MTVPVRVAICGGGNLAHALAAVAGGLPGVSVRVWTRRTEGWSHRISAFHEDLEVRGMAEATADPARAVAEARLVLVAAPATAHLAILEGIAPHLAEGACVGALPAVGGFNHAARLVLPPSCAVFGSARSPYNCRIARRGREVEILGILPKLQVAVEPRSAGPAVAGSLRYCLGIPVELLDRFVSVTLSPAGTIFHSSRIAELIDQERCLPPSPGFYEDWGEPAAATYLACDAELDRLCGEIGISRHGMSALCHYGTDDAAALAAKLRSLKGLRGIEVPLIDAGQGLRIDPASRFVTEDIPFGLAVAERIAALHTVAVPRISALLSKVRRHFESRGVAGLGLPSHLAALGPSDWVRP